MDEHQNFLAANVVNIFDALDDGVYVTNKEGITLHVNAMYEKLTGLKSRELIGQNVRVLKEKGLFDTVVNPRIVETLKPETRIQTLQDGKRVVLRGFPVFGENRELVMVITLVRDVTMIEQMREQIFQQKHLLTIYKNQIELLSANRSGRYNPYDTEKAGKFFEQTKAAGSTDKFLLLQGEKGAETEHVARLIHKHSPRKDDIFLAVDCTGIPESRMESELFGVAPEKLDSFTSAGSEGELGYFQIADKGTVFLDAVDFLPLSAQKKIMRVLETQEVIRVGSPAAQKVDVRIIASSNVYLKNEVKKGNFSKALYNRLSTNLMVIPPLRELPEIIPDTVDHYLKRYGAKYRRDISCPNETMAMFIQYQWPGNLRELRISIQSLIMSSDGDKILPENLTPSICNSKLDKTF